MKFEEVLKEINLKGEDEFQALQLSTIEPEESLGEKIFKLEEDRRLRKEAYKKMRGMVEGSLKDDEKIIFGAVLLQSNLRKRIDGIVVGGGGGEVAYYLGVFYTNKNFYIFEMNFKYRQLSEMYVNSIDNINHIEEKWDDIKTIVIEFNDDKRVLIRANGDKEEKLVLSLVRSLNEKGIAIKKYEEPKRLQTTVIVSLIFLAIIASVAAYFVNK